MKYDWRHRVHDLPDIPDDTGVRIQSETEALQGRISTPANTPRSYVVETPAGDLWRNRNHLSIIPSSHEMKNHSISQPGKKSESTVNPLTRRIMTRSQTGTIINPPTRL